MIFLKKKQEIKNTLRLEAIPSGSIKLDDLLGGGFQADIITHIFGPPGSGKTNICISASVECAKMGLKIAYIDTENGFNYFRFKQITRNKDISKLILLAQPSTFEEQIKIVENLENFLDNRFGLLVLDSAVSLYRTHISGSRKKTLKFNRNLAKQLSILARVSKKFNLATIVTNQVYDSFKDGSVAPVGGGTFMYWSKLILELKRKNGERLAILRKHPFLPDGKSIKFKITNKGLE